MAKTPGKDRLLTLLQRALDEADASGDTLVAALLAQCIAAIGDSPTVQPVMGLPRGGHR